MNRTLVAVLMVSGFGWAHLSATTTQYLPSWGTTDGGVLISARSNGTACLNEAEGYPGTLQGSCRFIPDTSASAYSNVNGIQLTAFGASSGSSFGSPGSYAYTGSHADAVAAFEDAGVVHVAGGGSTQVRLIDELTNSAIVSSGTMRGEVTFLAEWGPYTPSTETVEILNEALYNWTWDRSSCYVGTLGTQTYYCPALNSVTGVNLPLPLNDGDALLLSVRASVDTIGEGSMEVSDPLSIELAPGVTFTDQQRAIPVTYSQPSTAPEPSSLLLLGSGLAGLAGTFRRKLRR